MAAALTILAAMGVGGMMGLITRLMLSHGLRIVAAATENPYIVTVLIGAIGTLFGGLTYVAKLLLERTDKAHLEVLKGKDALIAQVEARLTESEQRSDRYENLVLRSLDAAKEAAHVASQVVTERGSGA
jgi:hypothetical protein